MIPTEEEILRAIELRLKTVIVWGTLCRVLDYNAIYNAMDYFDVWADHGYISNPYATLSDEIFDHMTKDLFRIFIEYTHYWKPTFSDHERDRVLGLAKLYGYRVTCHNNRVSFRRDIPS